jgi:hypothetical protein
MGVWQDYKALVLPFKNAKNDNTDKKEETHLGRFA